MVEIHADLSQYYSMKGVFEQILGKAATPEEEREEISELVAAKRAEVEDWAILIGFNHLLAGVEAFVAA